MVSVSCISNFTIKNRSIKTGIEAIPFDVAKINLPMRTWSNANSIEPEKLEK